MFPATWHTVVPEMPKECVVCTAHITGTARTRRVWDLSRLIPYGETTTYAPSLPGSVMASPLSKSAPPWAATHGKLTGYAGGSARKRHLLDLEREQVAGSERTPFQLALITTL